MASVLITHDDLARQISLPIVVRAECPRCKRHAFTPAQADPDRQGVMYACDFCGTLVEMFQD